MTETHLEDFADRIRPRAASNLLLWLVLGFFGVFVIWASLTQLDRTIHAPGRVIPSDRLQIISNLEGGIVAEILVHAGDLVKQGQPMVRLDKTQTGAELGSSEITVGALTAKIARLEAEITGRQPLYPVSTNAAVNEQIKIEQALHASRMSDLSSLSAAASARILQADRAVAEARATYQARSAARDSAQQQLGMIRPLVERGIEPQMALVQIQSTLSSATSETVQAQAGIARAQASVAEARASSAQIRQAWRSQAATELAAAQAEMAARYRQMPALADRLRRSDVASPVAGRVNRVLVATVGSSIGAGQPIAEVVPSAKTLTVEAAVSPKDIASVRIGQRARINVSAYESAVYGSLDGYVVTISPDATIEERTGESHYTVRLRVDADSLRDRQGRRLPIGPGMTADVNLLGDKRSIIAYIFTPISRLAESAFTE